MPRHHSLPLTLKHPSCEMIGPWVTPLGQSLLWQVMWPCDIDGRSLALAASVAPPGQRGASAINEPFEVLDGQFDTTRDRTTDTRRHESGEGLDLWGGKAEWAYGSDRVRRFPKKPDASGFKAQSAADRRHLVAFRWISNDERRAISGVLGEVLPDGEWLDPEAALQSLNIKFVRDEG